jgi:TPP-dependent 2-oxoacid decarboxylase
MNNGGYTAEVEIHDGPYNVIKNWNYTGLVDAIHNKSVRSEPKLERKMRNREK